MADKLTIEPENAKIYTDSWNKLFPGTSSEPLNIDFSPLFSTKQTKEKPAIGLDIPFKKFLPILGSIGTEYVKIRFGLNDENGEDKFCLVINGARRDEKGKLNISTSDYVCSTPEELSPSSSSEKDKKRIPNPHIPTGKLDNKIPPILLKYWTESWAKVANHKQENGGNFIPATWFLTYDQKPIKGYNFQYRDFIKIFDGLKLEKASNYDDVKISFRFFIHTWAEQNDKPSEGIFGLGVDVSGGVTKKSEPLTDVTQSGDPCWDTSFPCPPAC